MIASSMGWEIPGIERKEIKREVVKEPPITRTVTKEIPAGKVIESSLHTPGILSESVTANSRDLGIILLFSPKAETRFRVP